MAALFPPAELGAFLQRTVQGAGAVTAEIVAAAWLRAATGLTALPEPLPDDLHGWGLELGAIAYNSQTPDGTPRSAWEQGRREAILRAAGRAYGPSGAGGGAPLYSFPEWDWSWTADTTTTRTSG